MSAFEGSVVRKLVENVLKDEAVMKKEFAKDWDSLVRYLLSLVAGIVDGTHVYTIFIRSKAMNPNPLGQLRAKHRAVLKRLRRFGLVKS